MFVRVTAVLAMMLVTGGARAQEEPGLKTDREKLSYALGMDLGGQLRARQVDIDPEVFARALRTALEGGKTLLTEAEADAAIAGMRQAMAVREAEAARAAGEKNRQEGEAFLAANKDEPGVVALPSGLQYKVIKEGTGSKPTIDDTVVCNYRGTLIGGKEFDSSYKRNQPATFPVKGVIPGWTEVLQLMPVGSTWQVFIPSSLAYGERGAGADIGPNATLIFEVELIAIK
jgi:FKBP-type peptidyl-prolyl cis-trans isomerase FklB